MLPQSMSPSPSLSHCMTHVHGDLSLSLIEPLYKCDYSTIQLSLQNDCPAHNLSRCGSHTCFYSCNYTFYHTELVYAYLRALRLCFAV